MTTLTLVRGKETKNTFRYEEVVAEGDYPVVQSIYLPKPLLHKAGNPDTVTVTIDL